MERNFRQRADGADESPPSEASLFAQAVLGKPIPKPRAAPAIAHADRELLQWLADVSPEHARELRLQQSKEAVARADRALLEWLATISPRHEVELRDLVRAEAEAAAAREYPTHLLESSDVQEWDASKHPRGGFPENPGWFSPSGGGGASGSRHSTSVLDRIIQRNTQIGELAGVVTPGMIRANRLAVELQAAIRLPPDVAKAAAGGLLTGSKAVVNGFATAVKDVATLGLSPGQLELIGVTKEDRARGYDTAVAISTASGQVLIAVGTGGITKALGAGGSVAKTASGALVVFDAAGNAVGVVQGIYDATQNGVTVANGAKIAGGILGLGANVKAARRTSLDTLFEKPSEVGTPHLPAGHGRTDKMGNVTYSTAGGADDVGLARFHERVHSLLSPRFKLLRTLRADIRIAGYQRSSFLRYLEEALAETYAQLRVHGMGGLPSGITFPVREGYATVSAVVSEGAIGTVVVGGVTYGVYYAASQRPLHDSK